MEAGEVGARPLPAEVRPLRFWPVLARLRRCCRFLARVSRPSCRRIPGARRRWSAYQQFSTPLPMGLVGAGLQRRIHARWNLVLEPPQGTGLLAISPRRGGNLALNEWTDIPRRSFCVFFFQAVPSPPSMLAQIDIIWTRRSPERHPDNPPFFGHWPMSMVGRPRRQSAHLRWRSRALSPQVGRLVCHHRRAVSRPMLGPGLDVLLADRVKGPILCSPALCSGGGLRPSTGPASRPGFSVFGQSAVAGERVQVA